MKSSSSAEQFTQMSLMTSKSTSIRCTLILFNLSPCVFTSRESNRDISEEGSRNPQGPQIWIFSSLGTWCVRISERAEMYDCTVGSHGRGLLSMNSIRTSMVIRKRSSPWITIVDSDSLSGSRRGMERIRECKLRSVGGWEMDADVGSSCVRS